MSENRCVCCGTIIPEGSMVCSVCSKVEDNPVTTTFICEQLAQCFGDPCNMSPFEEELHDSEEKVKWCEKFCGKVAPADCWERYFKLKFAERSKE